MTKLTENELRLRNMQSLLNNMLARPGTSFGRIEQVKAEIAELVEKTKPGWLG